MHPIATKLKETNKAVPILTFPITQQIRVSVMDFVLDNAVRLKGLSALCNKNNLGAVIAPMDLSLEAEAFGATILFEDDKIPTVVGQLLGDHKAIELLELPTLEETRLMENIVVLEQLHNQYPKKLLFGSVIGPFTLAGRLVDVTEWMMMCMEEEDLSLELIEKCSLFLTIVMKHYKAIGLDGVVIAEPLTGLVSPYMAARFSSSILKKCIQEVQDSKFLVIYHNCGNIKNQLQGILLQGAGAIHVGNAANMEEVLSFVDSETLVLGNINPMLFLEESSFEELEQEITRLKSLQKQYSNFVLSSGCDIPAHASWQKIEYLLNNL